MVICPRCGLKTHKLHNGECEACQNELAKAYPDEFPGAEVSVCEGCFYEALMCTEHPTNSKMNCSQL
jgi:NMD protein affecting ribosome stability and mRNA decay